MSGCTKYKFAMAAIAFWDGDIRCDICPVMETYARKQCRLTGEYLGDTRGRGHLCPLKEISEEKFYGNPGSDLG